MAEFIPVVKPLTDDAERKQAAYAAKRLAYTDWCLDEFERQQDAIKNKAALEGGLLVGPL
jgi:hypothetical protein